ncbi:hypothetical protein [Piscinibacter sp.]|uniref:hypothetical protein n=1 Tax=Piscinibacter sp. TaxID=1903157 RepID=UPI002C86D7D7|nr:hypothetical protein [Albitalea sp.]HUG21325.1 hypothetical protein [Albitalea sp.]
MAKMRFMDLSKYTVYDLYAIGQRISVGYKAEDAIERYLELHPAADRTAVERELREQVQRQMW